MLQEQVDVRKKLERIAAVVKDERLFGRELAEAESELKGLEFPCNAKIELFRRTVGDDREVTFFGWEAHRSRLYIERICYERSSDTKKINPGKQAVLDTNHPADRVAAWRKLPELVDALYSAAEKVVENHCEPPR